MAKIVPLVLAHIFVIGGCYLFTWGINLLVKGSASPGDIFTKPLFWGLFLILWGFGFLFRWLRKILQLQTH